MTNQKKAGTVKRQPKNITQPIEFYIKNPAHVLMAIDAVMREYPDLSSYGWKFKQRGTQWNHGESFDYNRDCMQTSDFANQVITCLHAINTKFPRGQSLRITQNGSYTLKHMVESWARKSGIDGLSTYITNGAFIVASLIYGLAIVRYPNSPNCRFYRRAK